jgi:arabinofuranosyltransferase
MAIGIALVVTVVRSAWVCDDSFITLRTIDNFVDGHGLRWNVAERVQSFTHPLWMLLLASVYLVTHEAYYTVLTVSILLSAVVVWWLVARVARSALGALLAIAVLTLSKAYVDYSTSGLENPLTYLLLVLFLSFFLPVEGQERRPLALALVAGLLALNRMDLLLLILPALVGAMRELPWRRAVKTVLIGFSPFLVWELFALVYFGAPFPNSAYAKLVTGIPRADLIRQGYHYFLNSLGIDPVTLVAVGAAALFAVRRRDVGELLMTAGVGLYLGYVLWIGGDFMSGRFFAAPLLVSAALLARWKPERPGVLALLPFLAVALLGLATPNSPVYSGADYAAKHRSRAADNARITDERAFYCREVPMPNHRSAYEGRQARESGPAVVVRGGVGFFGYYAGPGVHIVEPWAVSDPLLARLPVPEGGFWRIGHFTREIPQGYEATLRTGENRIVDPKVARLYEALEVVTRGRLFSGRRLAEIWKLNTGSYRIRRE